MTHNLFANLPQRTTDELVDLLATGEGLRIERIVSTGQVSPPGFWYDQPDAEWVVLLQGAAQLRLHGEDSPRHLQPGDHLLIPAHCRHRVEWTALDAPTVWLAVHFKSDRPVSSQPSRQQAESVGPGAFEH
ncbi:MAG: cupin domain-containing protein [Planctomycetaceae bacterium]